MIRTYLIPLMAVAGVILAVWTVVQGSKPPMPQPPVVEPPRAPFATFVAGSGLVEASSQNIAIGTPVAGVCIEAPNGAGGMVKKGDVLFRLDARELEAQRAAREADVRVAEMQRLAREADVRVAQAQLDRLKLGTRPELLPTAEARVAEAQAALDDLKSQLSMWESVTDKRAVAADELSRRRFAVATAQARLDQAKAELALLRAGTWSADISVSESQLATARANLAIVDGQIAAAKANLETTKTELERRTIRAPIDGKLLQVNLRVGEFAQAGPLTTPLMVLGAISPLHVRVDVDENDAWRVKAGAKAVAFVRGNKDISAPLSFVRFEPYVIPKRSLTGESTERVDTRVLQVIYAFDPGNLPIYVGQQMDVYIEGEPMTTRPSEGDPAATPKG
jgi:multidrug resistance efflux pump